MKTFYLTIAGTANVIGTVRIDAPTRREARAMLDDMAVAREIDAENIDAYLSTGEIN